MLTIITAFITTALAFTTVAPGDVQAGRERPTLILADGGIAVANSRNRQGPGTIESHHEGPSGWSAAAPLDLPHPNLMRLQDSAIVGGDAVLAYLYDDTDWTQFGLENASQAELLGLMDQTRQVFLSYEIDGRWAEPFGVPLTRGARAARLYAGPDGALLVFIDDIDGNWDTDADGEISALVIDGNAVSEPIQLTDDAVAEVGFDAAWDGTNWIVGYGRDADGDPATPDDRAVHAARISSDGLLLDNVLLAGDFMAPVPPVPAVAAHNGVVDVLWVEAEEVVQARWDGGWSAIEASGMALPAATQLRTVEHAGQTLIVARFGSRFRVAYPTVDAWWLSGDVADLTPHRVRIRQWDALIDDDTLHLAWTGDIAHDGHPDPDALFHHAAPLGADVVVQTVQTVRRNVRSGHPFLGDATIINLGALPAFGLDLLFTGASVEAESVPTVLMPGESRQVRFTGLISDPLGTWSATAVHDDDDLNPDDDTWTGPRPTLPNFAIRGVRAKGDTVRVDVRETTGVLTGPVPVRLALQTATQTTDLATLHFDPRDPRPLVVDLDDWTPPWRLLAEVNPDRAIAESDITDNTGALQVLGETAFRITDVRVANGLATVAVAASGDAVPASVGVWLTQSAADATGSLRSSWSGTAAEVTLDGHGMGEVSLPIPGGAGEFRWAVVNPGRALPEADREDNIMRFTVERTGRVESDLQLDGREDGCGTLGLVFMNHGDAPSLGAIARVVGADGLPVAERVLPLVPSGHKVHTEFDGIGEGAWKLELHRLDRRTGSLIEIPLDTFDPMQSLDPDGDGYISKACGGDDCIDDDSSAFPGSATHEKDCDPKDVVGRCGCAVATGPAPLVVQLLTLLFLVARRRRGAP